MPSYASYQTSMMQHEPQAISNLLSNRSGAAAAAAAGSPTHTGAVPVMSLDKGYPPQQAAPVYMAVGHRAPAMGMEDYSLKDL